ncbi:MAG: DUF1674 domain-containing protein [Allosphingosinicella sp.]
MSASSSIGRARVRPAHLKAPASLSPSPPLPEPGPSVEAEESGGPKGEEPTRYGDWESGGRCWDF